MSNKRLLVGDAVRVYIDNIRDGNTARQVLGFIRYIGYIPDLQSNSFTQSIGVELISKIKHGHNGMINNVQYFNVDKGYGIHIPITNIIEIVSVTTVMLELKNTLRIIKGKESYIQNLESIIHSNKKLPKAKPKLLIDIDLDFPESQPPSNRNTFFIPEAITPISTNRISFPQIRPELRPQNIVVTPHRGSVNTPQSMSMSLTESADSETFSSYASSLMSFDHSMRSIPSSPITPMNCTPFVIYEGTNTIAHQHIQQKSRRFSLLHKIPIPEVRNKRNKSPKQKH